MKNIFLTALVAGSLAACATGNAPAVAFATQAEPALQAMTRRATELQVTGVALVAYLPGKEVKGWASQMVVVGALKKAPAANNRGANLLAIAYAKAAEMADTLQDSGTAGRPPLGGETGWKGGLIKAGRTGYVIAAFSGGPSESDVKIAQAGLDVLAEKL